MQGGMESSDIADIAARDAAAALAEDVGGGDLSAAMVAEGAAACGRLICRDNATLCGRAWFEQCFLQLDSAAEFAWRFEDGDDIAADSVVCETHAAARALLSGERSAINFLQTLSATATCARRMRRLAPRGLVVDTRKTIPKLRAAQKYAAKTGGVHNHRQGLFDEILIKENHLAAAGGIAAALQKARRLIAEEKIQIEVGDRRQLDEALAAGARRILLDNWPPDDLAAAVRHVGGRAELEASGGVDESNIAAIAAAGVDRVSVGAITKHVRAVDFSFAIVGEGG